MGGFWRNVRHAWRGLIRERSFTALAVLTLALGIGAATTIFSVIQNVLLDPFPYKEADRVVAVQIRDAARADRPGRNMFQTPEFLDYQEQSRLFDEVIAGSFEDVLYTTKDGTELLNGGLMSVNNFDFLGVPAAVGRTFAADDARPDAPPVFVMSHKMWRKYFAEDPGVLGRTFQLNGVPTTLVGIMPVRFTKLNADIYRPIVLDRADPQVNERFFMFQAKLKRGVTLQQAEAELSVLAARLPLPRGQYETAAAKQQFFQSLLTRLQSQPGVVAVTAATSIPPYGGIGSEIDIPGKSHSERWDAIMQLCSEGYFPTLGLRLLRGRTLTEADVAGGRRVIVVNQTLVSRYFGTDDPLGRMIELKRLASLPQGRVENPVFEIVGVVADTRNQGLQDPTMPEAFLPYTITGAFERGILMRTAGDPLLMVNTVRREVWAVDRNVAITLSDSLANLLVQFSYARPRFTLVVLGVFAAVGLMLVMLGVYGVIAYGVSRQTHEIGIRMALGAGRGRVLGMVMLSGLQLVGIGVGLGVLASLGLTRVLSNQLWNVKPHDPLTMALVVAVLAAAAGCACYFPARRATRVDPLVALRAE